MEDIWHLLRLSAKVCLWWTSHILAQILIARFVTSGFDALLVLLVTFSAASINFHSSSGPSLTQSNGSDRVDDRKPLSLHSCLHVTNLAGYFLVYTSLKRIPAYCVHSIKAAEVIFTCIFTALLRQHSVTTWEIFGCVFILLGFIPLRGQLAHGNHAPCNFESFGVLEVLIAAMSLPLRNVIFRGHGISPAKHFSILCREALCVIMPLVAIVGTILVAQGRISADTLFSPRHICSLTVIGFLFQIYNWASLRVLGDPLVSVQFHASLNVLKRGVCIAILFAFSSVLGDERIYVNQFNFVALQLLLLIVGCFLVHRSTSSGKFKSPVEILRSNGQMPFWLMGLCTVVACFTVTALVAPLSVSGTSRSHQFSQELTRKEFDVKPYEEFQGKNMSTVHLCFLLPWGANFGDDLGVEIFRRLAKRRNPTLHVKSYDLATTRPEKCIFGLGSIGHFLREKDVVWGTGVGSSHPHCAESPLQILALRGPFSKKEFLETCEYNELDVAFGDPGILTADLFPEYAPSTNGTLPYCIIPHHDDPESFFKRHEPYVFWPNVTHEVMLQNIRKCSRVISSSLHGIIVAESFNIPAQWLQLKNSTVKQSEGLKYDDYFSATHLPNVVPFQTIEEALREQARTRPPFDDLKAPLLRAFDEAIYRHLYPL